MTTHSTKPIYVLLVDDLKENLVALEALLARDGLRLLQARSGQAALELLLQHEVDLAILDVQMPGMDGFELAELMRGTDRTRRIPIIFVTAGLADRQRRFRGYEAGAVDFLQKPIEPEILTSKVDVFFEMARQRQELKAALSENAKLLTESHHLAASLRDADRRKDDFLATLAHELRNPLAPLRNGLQVIRKTLPGNETATNAGEMMERQLAQMVRLIDDLLDVSRISSGKIVLRKQIVDLQSVVELAVETSRPLIEAGQHSLTVHLLSEPVWIDGDATRISQALSNLLTNAAKYTKPGGRIEVSVKRDGEYVLISVRDSGLGIPKEMLSEVFAMFTQVNRTLDRSQGGLGIGLALVREIVELHSGSISAESDGPDKGSTFVMRLPAVHRTISDDNSGATNEAATSMPTGLRILVVDDNEDSADSLAIMLQLEGHDTRTALGGAEALESARAFLPQVVFLDIGLPGMSGYEVARQLRSNETLQGTVLVALTGWGTEEDKLKSKDAGFDFHLTKPVEASSVEELLCKVSKGEVH